MRSLKLILVSLFILIASYLVFQIDAISGIRRAIVGIILKGIGTNEMKRSHLPPGREIRLSIENTSPLLKGASKAERKLQQINIPHSGYDEMQSDRIDYSEAIETPIDVLDSSSEPSEEPLIEGRDDDASSELSSDEIVSVFLKLANGMLPEDISQLGDQDLTELFYSELQDLMGIPEEIEDGSYRELMSVVAPELSKEEIDLILKLGGSSSPPK